MEKFNDYRNQDIESANNENDWGSLAAEVKEENKAESQGLSQKESMANNKAFRSVFEWQKSNPETTVEELAETEKAIERTNREIELSEREARAKELAEYGYTGYED